MKERVGVIGFGITGQATGRYLLAAGFAPVIVDTRSSLEIGSEFQEVEVHLGAESWPDIDVTRAVLSPGLALSSCLVVGAQAAGVKLLSDIDLFFQAVDKPVIGITGTNGKSTVTAWVAHIINRGSSRAVAGGNLGEAALDLLSHKADVFVLELSSFQLERSGELPLAGAVILNVTPDHLDQHGDMQSYRAAKQRIYLAADRVLVNRAEAEGSVSDSFGFDAPERAEDWGVVDGMIVKGDEKVVPVADLGLQGRHNVLNAMASAALAEPYVNRGELIEGLRSFSGLAHRFDPVAELDGVSYINDSKATNLGATLAALAGMARDNSVVLIAGGDAKGTDLSPLLEEFRGRVKTLVYLGQDGPQVADIANRIGIATVAGGDIKDCVHKARAAARPGDTVLLSPACASLDMFKNYAERGDRFAFAVQRLAL